MTVMRYDEDKLRASLGRLPKQMQAAFAAACAERLLPAYGEFQKTTGRGDYDALALILEQLWRDLGGDPVPGQDFLAALDRCVALIPSEEDEPWIQQQAYAEDAAAALAYALRTLLTGDPRNAAWAARRAYEAIDHFVIHQESIVLGSVAGEEKIVAHPLVQAELLRQQVDIDELRTMTNGYDHRLLVERLRSRAREAARLFFTGGER